MVVLAFPACGSTEQAQLTQGSPSAAECIEPAGSAIPVIGVGEPVLLGGLSYTVVKAETANRVSVESLQRPRFEADGILPLRFEADGIFIIIGLSVRNETDKLAVIYDHCVRLEGGDGNVYTLDRLATTALEKSMLFPKLLLPGERIAVEAAYDVPEGAVDGAALFVSGIPMADTEGLDSTARIDLGLQ